MTEWATIRPDIQDYKSLKDAFTICFWVFNMFFNLDSTHIWSFLARKKINWGQLYNFKMRCTSNMFFTRVMSDYCLRCINNYYDSFDNMFY